jgi:hypothetical protein
MSKKFEKSLSRWRKFESIDRVAVGGGDVTNESPLGLEDLAAKAAECWGQGAGRVVAVVVLSVNPQQSRATAPMGCGDSAEEEGTFT